MLKKIILYGGGGWSKKRWYYLNREFKIVACCDKKLTKIGTIDIIAPGEINKFEYDEILIGSNTFYNEIKDELINKYKVSIQKISSGPDWWKNYIDFSMNHYGEVNTEKTFYLIRRFAPDVGLMSYYSTVIEHIANAEKLNYIPVVDMKNYPNFYLEKDEVGVVNSWEYYFAPLTPFSLDEVYNSKNVYLSNEVSQKDAEEFLRIYKDKIIRQKYQRIFSKYIHFSDSIQKAIDDEYEKLFFNRQKMGKKICGVSLRGADWTEVKGKDHPIQPSMDEAIQMVANLQREWKFDYIFLTTEDEKVFHQFIIEFDNVIHTERPLYNSDKIKGKVSQNNLVMFQSFNRNRDLYLKGKEYLIDMVLLSKCNFIIASRTTGSLSVLTMNNGFEKEYFFDLGLYG